MLLTTKDENSSRKVFFWLLGIYAIFLVFVQESVATGYKYPADDKVLVYAASYTYGGSEVNQGLKYVFDNSPTLFNQADFFHADLKILKDSDASLEIVKTFGDYGSVLIHTHGMFWSTDEFLEIVKKGIAGFRSGTEVQMPPMQRDPGYMLDLENFRLAVSKKPDSAKKYQYVVMPSYIEKYVANLNDTFFLLNYCHSLQTDNISTANNMMWNVLKDKGAKVAFGYSDEYKSNFGKAMFLGIPINDQDTDDLNERNQYGLMYWMLPRQNFGPNHPYTASEAYNAIPEEERISYYYDELEGVSVYSMPEGILQKRVASPEWDNFIFLTEPVYVVIKVGENSGTQFFTVWDPVANDVANINDPVTGSLITFPAKYSDIQNWLAERSSSVTTQAYKWEMENNALKRIGKSWQDEDNCTCTIDRDIETTCNDYKQTAVFNHPGCGDFQSYCNYSQTLSAQNGNEVLDTISEGRVYVDRYFWESILGSYAPLVNTSTANGEAACLRSEWYQVQSTHSYLPEGTLEPFNEWDISQPIKWITPIGEMDLPSQSYQGSEDYYSINYCPSTYSWSRWYRESQYEGDPIAKPIIYANYSDTVMVQLYFVSTVQWSGSEQEEQFIVDNTSECRVTAYEESFATDNKLVAACSVNNDGVTNLDPRNQERNPEFENAILSLVEHTINMQMAAGEITDQEVFKGGINLYIAKKANNGTESLIKLINDERVIEGIYPLLPDNNLNRAAQKHAADMAMNGFLGDIGSDAKTLQDRVIETGYTNIVKPGGSHGETEYISRGYNTADEFFTAFRNSSSWDIIMSSSYHEIGIGSEMGSDGLRYWCLTFGYNDEH